MIFSDKQPERHCQSWSAAATTLSEVHVAFYHNMQDIILVANGVLVWWACRCGGQQRLHDVFPPRHSLPKSKLQASTRPVSVVCLFQQALNCLTDLIASIDAVPCQHTLQSAYKYLTFQPPFPLLHITIARACLSQRTPTSNTKYNSINHQLLSTCLILGESLHLLGLDFTSLRYCH